MAAHKVTAACARCRRRLALSAGTDHRCLPPLLRLPQAAFNNSVPGYRLE